MRAAIRIPYPLRHPGRAGAVNPGPREQLPILKASEARSNVLSGEVG